ncbi:MAG: hypothetical protein KA795_19085 [Burkholderiaceae bacterium]|nr:hypothetical protein [Burkholderiaceae bacterium]
MLSIVQAAPDGLRAIDIAGAINLSRARTLEILRMLRDDGKVSATTRQSGARWATPDRAKAIGDAIRAARDERAAQRKAKPAPAPEIDYSDDDDEDKDDAPLIRIVHTRPPAGGYPPPAVSRPFSVFNLADELAA